MKKYGFLLIILTILSTMIFGEIIEVGSSGSPYATIKAAISKAVDGDTIRIFSGNYLENLRFSKSITLEGVNTHNVILKPLDHRIPTILVENAGQLQISGMTIYGETIAISLAMTNAIINSNKIFSAGDGIRAGTLNHELSIINNTISGHFNKIKNITTNAIMLVGVGKTIIENNEIQSFGTGIYLGGKKPVKIKENNLHSNYQGIYASGNTEAIITNNKIYKNSNCGILLVSKPIVTISSNLFESNGSYDIILADKKCSGEFLIDFSGKIMGNANTFEDGFNFCPEDVVFPEDFIR